MRPLPIVLLAVAALTPVAASAQAPAPARQCFYTRDWKGWKAADENSMTIRVGVNQLYRVGFTHGCPGLTSPAAHLITSSPTGSVCTALDLDVKVSDLSGFSTPCIVSSITRLTSAEIAALPKKLTP